MSRLTHHVRKGQPIMTDANDYQVMSPSYLPQVLDLCGYGQGYDDYWNMTPTDEIRPILDGVLNLTPVLVACKFEENCFIVNHSDDVTEEVRHHWSSTDFNELPEVLQPFLYLAFDKASKTFSVTNLEANIARYRIGPRKY